MPRDDRLADELHQAVEHLRAGRPLEAAAQDLAPELRPLLASAARLAAAGSARRGPRPSFVLGLEQQLRTDIRLHLVRPRPWAGRPMLLVAAALLLSLGLAVVLRFGPGTGPRWLAGVRSPALASLGQMEATIDGELDAVWARLDELGALVAHGTTAAGTVGPSVGDILARCSRVRLLARRSGNERLSARTDAELAAVAMDLERLAARAGPHEQTLRRGAVAIRRELGVSSQLVARGEATLPFGGRAATATSPATASPSPTTQEASTLTPGAVVSPSAVPSQAPSATSAVAPGSTRPREIPTASATAPPPTPVPSPAVVAPTAAAAQTAGAASPTATRDDHRDPTSTIVPTIAAATSPPTANATPPLVEPPVAPPLATPPDLPRP